jgi:hypothetical protein
MNGSFLVTALLAAPQIQAIATGRLPEPPQIGLLMDADHLEAVVCGPAGHKWFEQRYAARMKAVKDSIAREFGDEAANREYISIQPCYHFADPVRQDRAFRDARDRFEGDLSQWEARYGFPQRNKSTSNPMQER